MALAGAHIACGFISSPPNAALLGAVAWSQTMTDPGLTAMAAPKASGSLPGSSGSNQAFEVRSSADIFVAVGPAPDALNGPRVFVSANETRHLFCAPGDKLAWALA